MGRHVADLTTAQQQILDGCSMHDGMMEIPPYRLQQIKSARILEAKGYVTIERLSGGVLQVTRKTGRKAL